MPKNAIGLANYVNLLRPNRRHYGQINPINARPARNHYT